MSDSTPKSFGLLLRRFRRAAELTQEELAQRSDLSTRTINALERGVKATPQAGTLELLAAALELSDEDRALLLGSVPRRRRQPAATDPIDPLVRSTQPYLPGLRAEGKWQGRQRSPRISRRGRARRVTQVG